VGEEPIAVFCRKGGSGTSAKLSAGDVDADWQRADAVGEESVGGSVATADQSVVDELGAAFGVPRAPDEEVRTSHDSRAARPAKAPTGRLIIVQDEEVIEMADQYKCLKCGHTSATSGNHCGQAMMIDMAPQYKCLKCGHTSASVGNHCGQAMTKI
jgi:predicted RNA-binding Zn-ribbon protein involved in translation (DUF1610 family)